MSYSKEDISSVAIKLGKLVNGGVIGYYAGGKTSEYMSQVIPDKLIDVVESHKKIQLGTSLAQNLIPIPGIGYAADATLIASIWKMYYDINNVIGINISENAGKSIASAVFTNLSAYAATAFSDTVSEGVKMIPIIGPLAGFGISASSKTAIVYGSAYLYMNALATMYEVDGGVNADKVLSYIQSGSKEVQDVNQQDYSLPETNIGILGHVDHGKTSLAAAISLYLNSASKDGEAVKSIDELDDADSVDVHGVQIYRSEVTATYNRKLFHFYDCPGHADYVKSMVSGLMSMDAAILVVAATDGPMPQTREHVILARQVNVPRLVVFLNKCDDTEVDEEMIDLVKMDVQDLLTSYGYEEDTPIICGSALGALNGVKKWKDKVMELMDAVDNWIQEPVREVDKPFLMPVEDVSSITGRGTVVTGPIETGRCKIGDEVNLIGINDKATAIVTGIESLGNIISHADAGDNVGILLRGVDDFNVRAGMVLAGKGEKAHKSFRAAMYVLKESEGGKSTPFGNRYRPQFYIGTFDVTGEITLPDGVDFVMPGDNVEVNVKLIATIYLYEGQQFYMKEDDVTVGIGVITNIL